jgi:hypothetical protein
MAGISIASGAETGRGGRVSGVIPVDHDDFLPVPCRLAEASLHGATGVVAVERSTIPQRAEVAEW